MVKKEKKRISILVNPKTLKQWDNLADLIGTSRTAMIHNAIKVYELFITNQLNGDNKESIIEHIDQLKTLLTSYQERRKLILKEKEEIETSFEDLNIADIQDFNLVSKKILNLLKNWGSLPLATISAHLQYPGYIIWTVLKKLQVDKKVKVVSGEWSSIE